MYAKNNPIDLNKTCMIKNHNKNCNFVKSYFTSKYQK